MSMESAEGLKQLLQASGISLNSESARQLVSYLSLLGKWNKRINLTATTAWKELEPLFHEGIWASRFYPSKAFAHLDIGSGAGFPAIILRILVPHMRLEMVESRAKKSVFLETAIRTLGIERTCVHPERLGELLRSIPSDKLWDCVTWKGLKLSGEDLRQLSRHAHQSTQFWMFHGSQPAVEETVRIEEYFKLLWREKFPARREWSLSAYSFVFLK